MINFVPEFLVLKECKKRKVSFQEACFKIKTTTTISSSHLKKLAYNTKIILSHYFSLNYETFYLFPDIKKDSSESIFISLLLGHLHYLEEDEKEIKEGFLDAIKTLRLSLSVDELNICLKRKDEDMISRVKIEDEKKYLSLRFELPLFLLSLLLSQYDKKGALSVIKNLHGKENHLYLKNKDQKINHPKLKEENVLSIPSYIGKIENSNQLLKDKVLLKADYLPLKALSNISSFYGVTSVLLCNLYDYFLPDCIYLLLKNKTSLQIQTFIKNSLLYRKAVNYNTNKKISFISAPIEMIKTYIDPKDKSIVLISGCSNLLDNMIDPSILCKFEIDDVEKEKKKNLYRLFSTHCFVNEGGYLVYYNHSPLRKCNEEVIDEFLKTKDEFIKVKEENIDDSYPLPKGYYCILQRNKR